MPFNNNFYGVYKFIKINTSVNSVVGKNPYIIESLDDSTKMPSSSKEFMQGDPRNRILDISQISQDISISSPILVPKDGATPIRTGIYLSDGITLMNELLNLQYSETYSGSGIYLPNNQLPVLVNLKLNINTDKSNVSLSLKSDGNPNNTINVYQITTGSDAQNQIALTGLNNAARIAKNWDFAVNLGGVYLYVKDLSLNLEVSVKENNFLGSYPYAISGGLVNAPNTLDGSDGSYTGWLFPFLSVGSIKMTVSGKASISIDNSNNKINYNALTSALTTRDALIANAYASTGSVSLQNDGVFNYTTNSLQIYRLSKTASPTNLLPPILTQFNDAIVNTSKYNFSAGEMTFDFDLTAFPGA
jgi:hypothetical protein